MGEVPENHVDGPSSHPPGNPENHAGIIKAALGVASGSAVGLGGILTAAGQSALDRFTTCVAIIVFGVIVVGALAVAGAYALRRH
jgi:hypothetical protein